MYYYSVIKIMIIQICNFHHVTTRGKRTPVHENYQEALLSFALSRI